MTNFIQTENPFGLATPPAWFLSALFAYDPLLVIFPSKCAAVYRLARRTSTGRAQLNTVIRGIPDSEIYRAHRLWAWKSVEPQTKALGNSWQKLLLEIPEYDQQRFGSANQVADRLDRFDDEADAGIQRDEDNALDAMGHDAYIMATTLAGTRVSGARKPEGARTGPRHRRAYRPPNFGGGSAIFIGR